MAYKSERESEEEKARIKAAIEARTEARRKWDLIKANKDEKRCHHCDFTGMVLALDSNQNSYAFRCGSCDVAVELGLSVSIPLWMGQAGFKRL